MLKAESRADSPVTSVDWDQGGSGLGFCVRSWELRGEGVRVKEETLGKFSVRDTSDPGSPPSRSVLKVLGEISS